MKTIAFVLLMCTAPMFLSAQSKWVQDFFEKHADNEDYTLINVTGNLFNMLSDDNKKNKKTRIDGFQLLSAPKGSKGISASEVAGFTKKVKEESFEDLMTIRDKDSRINFMVQERKGIISELVMVINEPEEFTILSLRGQIPTSEIKHISDDVEVDGLEHLKDLR